MGGLEVLFWLAIIVFSLLRRNQQNKKRPKSKPLPQTADPSSNEAIRDPLQEALREIESALRGEPLPPKQPPPSDKPQKADPIPELKPSKPRYEPEFHSMESSIPSRELESKTTYSETYIDKSLEKKTTYEDTFRTSKYFDDSFSHAHPDDALPENQLDQSDLPTSSPHPLRERLKNRDSLAEAIVLQTILTRRSFPPGRDRR